MWIIEDINGDMAECCRFSIICYRTRLNLPARRANA